MTLDSTINNARYYNSDKNDAKSDPKSDQLVDTHNSDGKKIKVIDTDTNNENYPQKLLINRTLLIIIPPIDPQIPDGVATCRATTYAR